MPVGFQWQRDPDERRGRPRPEHRTWSAPASVRQAETGGQHGGDHPGEPVSNPAPFEFAWLEARKSLLRLTSNEETQMLYHSQIIGLLNDPPIPGLYDVGK